MEQFDQLEQIPRFQADVNHRPISPTSSATPLSNKILSTATTRPGDQSAAQKTYQTVSGLDFMYGSGYPVSDGNVSPANHENEDHGNSDHDDGVGTGVGIVTGDLIEGGVKGPKAAHKFMGQCKVCGDDASGMYFGALVCVPCKTFFLRYYGDNFSFVCRNQKDCEINIKTRTQCKYCRMQKCLQVGMLRRVRPSQVQISEGQQLCVVCSDLANGLHFGAITCEGCKKFFRRGLKEHPQYICKNDKDCMINPRTRNACRFCRYQKCLSAGMCREAIQMGRPSKFRGHSLYNSNLPFPKVNRMEEPNGNPASMNASMAAMSQDGFHPNMAGGSGLAQGPKSLPIPQLDANQMLSLARAQQLPMRDIKIEPPDYDFHQSPLGYSPYGDPGSHPRDIQDSILNMSNPWDVAIKTMNQEMNSAVSNFLTSNQNELIDQITQNLKYTTAGGVSVTETSTSLMTMSSICEARPSNTTVVCAGTTNQIVSSANYKAPSPEELDIMSNLQKALAVLEDPHVGAGPHTDSIIIGEQGTAVQSVPTSLYRGRHQQPNSLVQAQHVPQNTWVQATTTTVESHHQPLPQPPAPPLQHQQQLSPISATSPASHNSSLSPPSSTATSLSANQQLSSPDQDRISLTQMVKVPLSQIVKSEIEDCSVNPLGVQQDSLKAFNSFMNLSQQQLIEWIEFLQKQRKTISPNNHTIRAIKQTTTQDFNPEYWQKPELPDENIFFTEDHRQILDQIIRAYSAFVEGGHKINIQLTREFQDWLEKSGYTSPEQITDSDFPDFFNKRVVELYTVCSVAYCKKLPGFTKFDPTDQYNIVRLGQSQSRILAAACHWYKQDKKEFDYFLSWKPKNALREYKFKDSCLKYAEMIVHRDWDPIESALTNVLVLIATDYPDLKNPDVIEETRMNILRSFRAYTTAKYGTPNCRIEELFSYIPKLRELGLLHYKWTMVTVLEQETMGNKPDTGTQEDILL